MFVMMSTPRVFTAERCVCGDLLASTGPNANFWETFSYLNNSRYIFKVNSLKQMTTPVIFAALFTLFQVPVHRWVAKEGVVCKSSGLNAQPCGGLNENRLRHLTLQRWCYLGRPCRPAGAGLSLRVGFQSL